MLSRLPVPVKSLPIPANKYKLKCPYSLTPQGLTIHDTANNPSALSEASFSAGNTWEVSSHIYVDESQVVLSVPFNRNAWHAGDGADGRGNRTTLCIEICRSTSPISTYKKAQKNAAVVAAHILSHYGWTTSKMYRHYDWSGKNCPHRTMELGWSEFVTSVNAELSKLNSSTRTPILGRPTATVQELRQYAKDSSAPEYWYSDDPSKLDNGEDIPLTCYSRSVAYGVDPAVAWTQACKETGFGKFGGVNSKDMKNPCGLKTTQGGSNYDKNAHSGFKSWNTGFAAQCQHLALYAGSKSYPWKTVIDPRHFPHLHGAAPYVEDLGGKWAPSSSYGLDIVKMMDTLSKVEVKDAPSQETPPKESGSEVPSTPDTYIFDYGIGYVADGDIDSARFLESFLRSRGYAAFAVKSSDLSNYSCKDIIQVGGSEVKDATVKLFGPRRSDTMTEVSKYTQNFK